MKATNTLKHVAEVMIEKIEKKKRKITRGMFGNRLKQAQVVAVLNTAPLWLHGLAEYAGTCNSTTAPLLKQHVHLCMVFVRLLRTHSK